MPCADNRERLRLIPQDGRDVVSEPGLPCRDFGVRMRPANSRARAGEAAGLCVILRADFLMSWPSFRGYFAFLLLYGILCVWGHSLAHEPQTGVPRRNGTFPTERERAAAFPSQLSIGRQGPDWGSLNTERGGSKFISQLFSSNLSEAWITLLLWM